ncbi:Dynamin-1-like protein isoform X4 [Aphelenchoides fujianensis]|nr:Dynamin-1-like protein isoform X4 [Aphelenchoides fujianensis]
MENLAQAMTKLDQIKATTKVDLKLDVPKIVVLGAQVPSVGKSSVLERIVDEEFLPRGTGIVTRVPLILTLVNTPEGDKKREKYGRISFFMLELQCSLTDAKHTGTFAVFGEDGPALDIRQVCAQIEQRTKDLVGPKASNSLLSRRADIPIFLSIYSETVPNLGLVDLPGLTGQAADGQPEDISEKIKAMALKYISGENAIILAISEATSDIINSQSLCLAKQVDPECKRTIAVLTKLDVAWENRGEQQQAEESSNRLILADVLRQEFVGNPLSIKLGIIGVMNRSNVQQSASTGESSLSRKPATEKEFLAKHNLKQKHGIRVLSETLANQLQDHIRKCVPELERQVKKKKQSFREELDKFGQKYDGSKEELRSIVSEFTHVYEARIRRGCSLDAVDAVSAADIRDIFHPHYTNELKEIVPLEGYSHEQLMKVFKDNIGLYPMDMPHPEFMIDLIRKSTKKMQQVSELCADMVYNKLMDLFEVSDEQGVFPRFDNIEKLFRKTLETMLNKQLEIAKQYIKVNIAMQSSFINDSYPPYQERSKKIDDENGGGDANVSTTDVLGKSEQDKMNTVVKKVVAYFETSRDIVSDSVKKLIVYHLIGHVEKNLNACLNHQVDEANTAMLFAEHLEVQQKRQKLEDEIEAYAAIREVCGNSTATSTI